MRAIKNVSFIKFEQFCQKLWALVRILALFTTDTYQIQLNHATLDANFENSKLLPH